MERRVALAFARFDQAELRCCRYLNRSSRWSAVRPLAGPLAAFTLLIALSRVILGLHYPTDVAAGAALGGALAVGSLLLGQSLMNRVSPSRH